MRNRTFSLGGDREVGETCGFGCASARKLDDACNEDRRGKRARIFGAALSCAALLCGEIELSRRGERGAGYFSWRVGRMLTVADLMSAGHSLVGVIDQSRVLER